MNYDKLLEDIKEEYVPVIKLFVDGLELLVLEISNPYDYKIDFSDSGLSPYMLHILLEEL